MCVCAKRFKSGNFLLISFCYVIMVAIQGEKPQLLANHKVMHDTGPM